MARAEDFAAERAEVLALGKLTTAFGQSISLGHCNACHGTAVCRAAHSVPAPRP